ncbi:MAG: hypothetical protein MR966_15780 [Lachnospiraceae bacterium]|nr:hypothetical protein [Lachnospiraceae bacterium]MDD7390019.1 hypothetical protein [Lachnospiraceae bacterium]MDY4970978.1 hypothetical protein [Lachnospiraceae bacterium]
MIRIRKRKKGRKREIPAVQQVENPVPASDYQCVACGKIGYLPEGTIICWECQQIAKNG